MERTRHFVATVYVVVDGAIPLHEHERLEMWLPPGGHVQRVEAPHETAIRETREETGLDVELTAERSAIGTDRVEAIPRPIEVLREDINVCDGEVGHQHVDFIYFGTADRRTIEPAAGEAPPDRWSWFTRSDLEDNRLLEPDVRELGRRAIEACGMSSQD